MHGPSKLKPFAVFEGLRSVTIDGDSVRVVSDCMHVSGAIPGLAPSEGRNPPPGKGRVAEQPVPSKRGKKPL